MQDLIQIQTTTDQHEAALTIAQDLVAQRLAACVQVSGPVTSVYRWAGQVETATEWICSIKTTADLWVKVQQRIEQLHTYEQPEIIARDIPRASPGYRAWLEQQVVGPDEDS